MSEQLESELTVLTPALSTSDLSAFAADAEMVAEFVVESREHLAAMEEKLLLIEKDFADLESIGAVFRSIHTIKGLAGFLELQAIQEIAHEVETLLDHARCRRLVITPPLVDALFEGIDSIRHQVDGIQRHLKGGVPTPAAANSALLQHLREIGNNAAARSTTAPLAAPPSNASTASDDCRSSVAIAAGALSEELSVRIETSKLDQLMEMVGELVIANTIVSHNPRITLIQDHRLAADLARLDRITTEVQRITTSMRMVPIGIQFQKMARIVRDLSRQLGKQVAMVTSGEETELDKSIAEALAGPLMHMVRNSVDHGIESFEERALTGKDPVAQVRLAAYHESAQIVIEISDDGRGLDRDRILLKAVERGLVKPGTQLSDAEAFQLIFEPGFSTAERVTGISGRGVGMDVVRRHVQKLRGHIDIKSEAGVGTTFFLCLPLNASTSSSTRCWENRSSS